MKYSNSRYGANGQYQPAPDTRNDPFILYCISYPRYIAVDNEATFPSTNLGIPLLQVSNIDIRKANFLSLGVIGSRVAIRSL